MQNTYDGPSELVCLQFPLFLVTQKSYKDKFSMGTHLGDIEKHKYSNINHVANVAKYFYFNIFDNLESLQELKSIFYHKFKFD